MQKSNANLISLILNDVCDILNKDYDLQGLDFIAENRFDIETEISTRLKKQGVCCLVMTPTLTFLGISDTHTDIIYQIDNLTVQITEYVPINRAKNRTNIKTCQDIAIRVADVLGGPTTNNWQNFQLVDIQTGEDNGLLISKVTFSCLAQGNLSAIPAPYDPSVKIPFATKTQLDELSVHFESLISSIPETYYDKQTVDQKTAITNNYSDTLLSGVTENDETVEFYILTKNK